MSRTGPIPAKVVLEWHVRPGAQARFDEWAAALVATATRDSALQGSSVLTAASSGESFVLLRFASQADLDRWQRAPEVEALLKEAEPLSMAPRRVHVKTGLETWFTLRGEPAPPAAPPEWKMALVTWLALLPQVIGLSFLVPVSWPFLLNVAVTTAIPVALLTWLVMPGLTRLLYGWLYAPAGGGSAAAPGARSVS